MSRASYIRGLEILLRSHDEDATSDPKLTGTWYTPKAHTEQAQYDDLMTV